MAVSLPLCKPQTFFHCGQKNGHLKANLLRLSVSCLHLVSSQSSSVFWKEQKLNPCYSQTTEFPYSLWVSRNSLWSLSSLTDFCMLNFRWNLISHCQLHLLTFPHQEPWGRASGELGTWAQAKRTCMQGEGAEGHRCSILAVEWAPCIPGLHPGPVFPAEQVELPFFLFLELSGCLGSCVFTTVGFSLPCQFWVPIPSNNFSLLLNYPELDFLTCWWKLSGDKGIVL